MARAMEDRCVAAPSCPVRIWSGTAPWIRLCASSFGIRALLGPTWPGGCKLHGHDMTGYSLPQSFWAFC